MQEKYNHGGTETRICVDYCCKNNLRVEQEPVSPCLRGYASAATNRITNK